MKIKKGLKFRKYYNDDNFNNIDYCEIRGIVDNYIIVVFCRKQKTALSDEKEFYKTYNKDEFINCIEKNTFRPL